MVANKTTLLFGPMLIAILVVLVEDQVQSRGLCRGELATFNCLKQNFRELYKEDHNNFFAILHAQETKSSRCAPLSSTSELFGLAKMIGGNAEVGEDFREFLENLLKKNPKCFLDALLNTEVESRDLILNDFLHHPLFMTESEVKIILSEYRKEKKYKELLKESLFSGK